MAPQTPRKTTASYPAPPPNITRHHAAGDGATRDLTPGEFALRRYFMSRPGEVVSREELLDTVWDEYADPFTQTVRVTVGTLRRKLGTVGGDGAIETVIGRGYRLGVRGEAG